jgi:predicted anti-sigma-YlaC factor YlaD
MREIPESAFASLEEHLLICSECRDRLTAADQYVAAVRSAAKTRAEPAITFPSCLGHAIRFSHG